MIDVVMIIEFHRYTTAMLVTVFRSACQAVRSPEAARRIHRHIIVTEGVGDRREFLFLPIIRHGSHKIRMLGNLAPHDKTNVSRWTVMSCLTGFALGRIIAVESGC